MAKEFIKGNDAIKSVIEGINSTILITVNVYTPNNAKELIRPPTPPIKRPSIKNGSLMKLLGAPSSLSISISSVLLLKNILIVL